MLNFTHLKFQNFQRSNYDEDSQKQHKESCGLNIIKTVASVHGMTPKCP